MICSENDRLNAGGKKNTEPMWVKAKNHFGNKFKGEKSDSGAEKGGLQSFATKKKKEKENAVSRRLVREGSEPGG